MARHVWSIACQTLLTDNLTNLVSYVQAMEGLSVSQLPVPAPPIWVGSLWVREGDEQGVAPRIRILSPNGEQVALVEIRAAQFGAATRMRQNTAIGGFALTAAGTYEVVIEQRRGKAWVEEARLPIDVALVAPPQMRALVQQRAQAASGIPAQVTASASHGG
jgi:hypothetical protein